jgi:hypothetical protein
MIFFVPPDNQMRPTTPLLCDRAMTIVLGTPDPDGLSETLAVLREWQHEGAPMQLHPGDLSWYGRHGTEATADAIRTWSRGGRTLAIGLLDGPGLLRMTIAPDAWQDEELARQLLADVTTPDRGVLPAGEADIEAPTDVLLQSLLADLAAAESGVVHGLHQRLQETHRRDYLTPRRATGSEPHRTRGHRSQNPRRLHRPQDPHRPREHHHFQIRPSSVRRKNNKAPILPSKATLPEHIYTPHRTDAPNLQHPEIAWVRNTNGVSGVVG